jgi:hypothetical protein
VAMFAEKGGKNPRFLRDIKDIGFKGINSPVFHSIIEIIIILSYILPKESLTAIQLQDQMTLEFSLHPFDPGIIGELPNQFLYFIRQIQL